MKQVAWLQNSLKSKMYIFTTENNRESKKAKHINKNVVDDELKYQN